MAARAKTEEASNGGAPEWMVTYGDMMGLLLCFFIMLVAMSEVKSEKFRRAMESIRQAFGGRPEILGTVGTDSRVGNSLVDRLAAVRNQRGDPDRMGGAETVNLRGSEYLCKTVRDGLMITFGLNSAFERGGVDLSDQLRKELDDLAYTVRGLPNVIAVHGNCSSDEVELPGQDPWTLSFERALAVGRYLMTKDISSKRLRLEGRAQNDPIETNLTVAGRARNRRVEIIVSTELVGSR